MDTRGRKRVRLTRRGRAVVVLLTLATLYMPWNGLYAWHRGEKAADQQDYESALYWYEKAERAYPDDKGARANARWARHMVEMKKRD